MTNSFNWKPLRPLLAVAVLGIAVPAFAIDLLELPAVKSNAASRALLLDVVDRGDGSLAAVGTFGVIIVSNDNGSSWTQAEVPASVTLTGVHFPTPDKGWAVGHDGLVLHSSDGGLTWQKQYTFHQGSRLDCYARTQDCPHRTAHETGLFLYRTHTGYP